MPPGYNPSDDSDDEYTPNPKKKGRKNDDSDTDSDEQSKPKKSRRSSPIHTPRFSTKFQSSPNT